jgi:hypothetical protein
MPKGSVEWEYDPDEGLVLRIRPMFSKLLSDRARAHIKESRKEMLVALRNLIDAAIQKMDEEKKTPTRGTTKIKVE